MFSTVCKLIIIFGLMATSESVTLNYFAHRQKGESDSVHENCVCLPFWQCMPLLEDKSLHNRKRSVESKIPCTGEWDMCCEVIKCGRKYNGIDSHFENDPMKRTESGNDSQANFAEFPWMLGVLQNNNFLCGASLIHPRAAITAAHCVSASGRYTIRAGELDWNSDDEPLPYQERKSQEVVIHPMYKSTPLQHDLAVIIFESPFVLSGNIGLVCLPPQGSTFVDEHFTAHGWGKRIYHDIRYQAKLKKVNLPSISRENCEHSLREAGLGPRFKLHGSFICAGGEDNRDMCKGDGGSPLLSPTPEDADRYVQIGIVSWGLTCGLRNTPGVYVNVPLYVDWIDEQMEKRNFDVSVYKI